jgi:hypothetical protein
MHAWTLAISPNFQPDLRIWYASIMRNVHKKIDIAYNLSEETLTCKDGGGVQRGLGAG